MDEISFRIILGILMISFVAHRGYYTRKVQHAPDAVLVQPTEGRMHRIANYLGLPAFVSMLLYLFYPPWISWGALQIPVGLRWLGVGIAVGGFALLHWAQVTLGKSWSDDPMIVKGQALVESGPYRRIRHPTFLKTRRAYCLHGAHQGRQQPKIPRIQ